MLLHAYLHVSMKACSDISSYPQQTGAQHRPSYFAKELVNVIRLLRNEDLPAPLRESLSKLLEWTAHNSSLQQTIPFTCIQAILAITRSGDAWEAQLTDDVKFKLGSWLGQPAVLDVFTHLPGCSAPIVSTVFGFLDYLCRNVSNTLPREAFERVMRDVPKAWSRAFPQVFPEDTSASDVRMDPDPVQHCETKEMIDQRIKLEACHGMCYNRPILRARGWYKHAEDPTSSTCKDKEGDDATCNKSFPHAHGQTCKQQSH